MFYLSATACSDNVLLKGYCWYVAFEMSTTLLLLNVPAVALKFMRGMGCGHYFDPAI